MTEKTLYRIDINWHGKTHTFYRYTRNGEEQALKLAVLALAREIERTVSAVSNYVHDGHDRYLVRKEVKKMVEPYRSTSIAYSSVVTDVLMSGFREVCIALETISLQLAENKPETVGVRGAEVPIMDFDKEPD